MLCLQLIPEDSASTDYYALTWFDSSVASQARQTLSIASFNAETNLEINLASGVSLIFNGVTYNQGTPLRLTIRRWATFHLLGDAGQDLTGASRFDASLHLICCAVLI